MAKLVIILGAGASVESGVPAFANFRERALEVIDDPRLTVALQTWGNFYSSFNLEEIVTAMGFHQGVDAHLPSRWLSRAARDAGIDWPEGHGVPYAEIARLLEEAVPQTLIRTASLSKRAQYELLRDQVIEAVDAGHEVDVVSFNWETLFEDTMAEKRGYWSPWVGMSSVPDKPRMVLWKPHGSINLETCINQKCDAFGQIYFRGSRLEWFVKRRVDVGKCSCGSIFDLIVFPPHLIKEMPSKYTNTPDSNKGFGFVKEWYQKTWRGVYTSVRDATHVISLGFSWPATDYPMRIQSTQGWRFAKRSQHIACVTGPAQGTDEWRRRQSALEERLLSLVPSDKGHKVEFRPTGITSFLKERRLIERLA